MPTADDLFRPTGPASPTDEASAAEGKPQPSRVRAVPDADRTESAKGASGRVRHDEKMTVYVTAAELIQIEQARLNLRGDHGLVVDRGRLVREALSLVLADLEQKGGDSALVQRLTG